MERQDLIDLGKEQVYGHDNLERSKRERMKGASSSSSLLHETQNLKFQIS